MSEKTFGQQRRLMYYYNCMNYCTCFDLIAKFIQTHNSNFQYLSQPLNKTVAKSWLFEFSFGLTYYKLLKNQKWTQNLLNSQQFLKDKFLIKANKLSVLEYFYLNSYEFRRPSVSILIPSLKLSKVHFQVKCIVQS